MKSIVVAVALVAAIAVTRPLIGQDIPAGPASVTTQLDQSQGNEDQVIYVDNRSTHSIIVTSVRLMECENIQGNCSTIRRKIRIPGGARIQVYRVRARFPDQGTSFRYTFTWEEEAAEGPSAKDVAKDSTALMIDSVEVSPRLIDLKVGETLDLSQLLAMKAMNAKGQAFPRVWFWARVAIGEDLIQIAGTKITGVAAGTAAIEVSFSTVASLQSAGKFPVRIAVQVAP